MSRETLLQKLNSLSLSGNDQEEKPVKVITTNQLNEQQEKLFEEVTSADDNLRCVFISGPAGTGKSVLLRKIASYYKFRAKVVAHSAIAARNVNGSTIHSTFKLNFSGDNTGKPNLYLLEVLIIDEISMVSDKMLDTIDKTMQKCFESTKPFGGKKVICFGDLFQLEPFNNENLDGSINHVNPVFYANCWKNFKYRELTKNMRQSEEEFIKNLNLLRKGDASTITYFNKFVKEITPQIEKESTTLVPTLEDAKIINRKILSLIRSENPGTPTLNMRLKNRDIYVTSKELNFAYPAGSINRIFHDNIALCKGAKIMFTVNDQNYLNGDIGIIETITPDFLEVLVNGVIIVVKPVEILFKKTGVNYYKAREFKVNCVTGFPIEYAWACTIHKMQGITVDKLIIKTANIFAKGQVYVAFSRVRHSDGISLGDKISPKVIKYNRYVETEYQRLRNLPE